MCAIAGRISGVDSGSEVDLGVYSAPNQPRSPNPPRSFTELAYQAALAHHSTHGHHNALRTSAPGAPARPGRTAGTLTGALGLATAPGPADAVLVIRAPSGSRHTIYDTFDDEKRVI